MTGQHVGIAAATEPQQPKRKSYATVVGLDGVGDVSILMGPIVRAGQGPLPPHDHTEGDHLHLSLFQVERPDVGGQFLASILPKQAETAAKGSHRFVQGRDQIAC